VADVQANQGNLFQSLVGRLGISGALQLLSILDPNASDFQKAFGGAQLANTGLQGLEAATGLPSLAALAKYGGPALGLAATGYNLANIVQDPNLSTGQKAGHAATQTGLGALSYLYSPYVGAALAANAVGKQLETSGSPQIKKLGTFLDTASEPHGVQGLLSVIQGDKSPAAAFRDQGGLQGAAYDVTNILSPGLGSIFEAMGWKLPFLSHTPTTGTMVRDEAARVANQIPGLKGSKFEQDALTIPQYNAFTPDQQHAAYALANLIGGYSPDYKKSPKDYQIQLGNSLLKQYGPNIVGIATNVFDPQQQPQIGQMTSPQAKTTLPTAPGQTSTQYPYNLASNLASIKAMVQQFPV